MIVNCAELESSDDVGPTLTPQLVTTSSLNQNVSVSPSAGGNEVELDNLETLETNVTNNNGSGNGTGNVRNSSVTGSLISKMVFCVSVVLNLWFW